jgi:hypothetical protein
MFSLYNSKKMLIFAKNILGISVARKVAMFQQ